MEREPLISVPQSSSFSPSPIGERHFFLLLAFQTQQPVFQGNSKGGGETAAVPALVNERVKYTTDLARLATSNPILAFTLTVVMFSIAGIPPTGRLFIAKHF